MVHKLMKTVILMVIALAALAVFVSMRTDADELTDGTSFGLGNVPEELVVERRVGEPVRFSLQENPSTGYMWEASFNTTECEVVLKRRGSDDNTICGAPGKLDVTVTSRVYTPVRVEFYYRRPWEKKARPWKTLRLIVNQRL